MAVKYRCKPCGKIMVPLEEMPDIQVGPLFWDMPGFVCTECDYVILEAGIKRGIKTDPNFDIEEVKNEA